MTSRRSFLGGTAAGLLAAPTRAAKTDPRSKDLYKEDLPTPCMIVDSDLFEQNIRKMAGHGKATNLHLRPHVKVHKSVDVAKRQIALGAIGLTVATIAEAELMSGAGIRGVFLTRQPAGKNNIARVVALSKRDPTFVVVVDDPIIADQLEQAAAASGARLNVAADVYAGLTRHGMEAGQPALELAQKIHSSKNLRLAGLMGYSGGASHTHTWEKRRQKSQKDVAGLLETVDLCKKSGLPVNFVSGGSTGTYNIDVGSLTELQCGSYVFMDTAYRKVGGKSNESVYEDWGLSLTVMTTVISKRHPRQCTIDAGNKALLRPTDEVKGMPWITVENQGAEYGILKWKDGDRDLKLGERVELYPTNLDMSTNCYDKYYLARGEKIVDVWPIMGRAGAAQR
jgi:D-serine deaminase-like pyridoxal phosphate-dependent protein